MATQIALLRGVNVGNNMLKMERLRNLWSEAGFENVRTYLQSGNVLFEAKGSAAAWQKQAIAKLDGETRLPVSIVFRTATELAKVLAGNPFLEEKGIDLAKLHVTFLADKPKKEPLAKLAAIEAGDDRLIVKGREVYLYCPGGYGETKLSNGRIEKVLGMTATTRNWKTVGALCDLAKG